MGDTGRQRHLEKLRKAPRRRRGDRDWGPGTPGRDGTGRDVGRRLSELSERVRAHPSSRDKWLRGLGGTARGGGWDRPPGPSPARAPHGDQGKRGGLPTRAPRIPGPHVRPVARETRRRLRLFRRRGGGAVGRGGGLDPPGAGGGGWRPPPERDRGGWGTGHPPARGNFARGARAAAQVRRGFGRDRLRGRWGRGPASRRPRARPRLRSTDAGLGRGRRGRAAHRGARRGFGGHSPPLRGPSVCMSPLEPLRPPLPVRRCRGRPLPPPPQPPEPKPEPEPEPPPLPPPPPPLPPLPRQLQPRAPARPRPRPCPCRARPRRRPSPRALSLVEK